MKPITALALSIGVATAWKILRKRSQKIGAMSDAMPTLDNLKRGIANGWYTARLTIVDGQQAVELSGKLIDGKPFQDVHPITIAVAQELRKMGVTDK